MALNGQSSLQQQHGSRSLDASEARSLGRPHALLSDIINGDDDDDDDRLSCITTSTFRFHPDPYITAALADSLPYSRQTTVVRQTSTRTLSTLSEPVFPQHRGDELRSMEDLFEPHSKIEHTRRGPQQFYRDLRQSTMYQSQQQQQQLQQQQQQHLPYPPTPHLPQRSMSMVEALHKDGLSPSAKQKYRSSAILYQSFLQTIQDGEIQLATQLRDELQQMLREETFQGTGDTPNGLKRTSSDRRGRLLDNTSDDDGWVLEGLRIQDVMSKKLEQAQSRMLKAHNQIRSILEQDYRYYENLPPKLFIILPRDELEWESPNPSNTQFRLFFLCDCGEHTKPGSSPSHDVRQRPRGPASQIPHHIHLAKHEGYEIEKPEKFFYQFGCYVLKILYMFKYGVSVAGYYVPVLMPPKAIGGMECGINHAFNHFAFDIGPGVNQAIDFLQTMLAKGLIPTTMTENEAKQQNIRFDQDYQRAEEVVDLRRLNTFLRGKSNKTAPFGNMHRMVTQDGFIKWVCADHFGEAFDAMLVRELSTSTTLLNGKFEEELGRLEIPLQNNASALKFYKKMENAALVQELKVTLQWEVSLSDLKALSESVQRSNMLILEIKCTPSTTAIDLLNRKKKRADPLWEMLSVPNLHTFILRDYTGFFSCVSIPARLSYIRRLEIYERIDWKKDGSKVIELLHNCPGLTALHLGCNNVDRAWSEIERISIGFCPLERVTLDGGEHSGVQVIIKKKKVIWMELLVMDLTEPLIYNAPGLRSLHLRLRNPSDFNPHTLEDVIAKVPKLTSLKINCRIAHFQQSFLLIKETASMTQACELNTLILYDTRNQLYSNNLKGQADVRLELMSTSTYHESVDLLIKDFGTRLTKLFIEGEGFKCLAPLAKTLRHAKTSVLENVVIACSPISHAMIQDLRVILTVASSTLMQLTLVIYEEWDTTSKNLSELASFIVDMEPLWTRIILGTLDSTSWKKALRARGFNGQESLFKRGPSLAKRITDVESKYGLIPNLYVPKLSIIKPAGLPPAIA
ncbi:hypothetical protein B0O80DRAFT_423853 [Mortierella sp. GBAus27b]|nr:hypothetical protein BGX31_006209 [Mortierella sp. GBA43]KAI8358821.1 hypothetical protein B0O80DRAFT_423853 [Mortierella sp. GBAus27b]